MLIKFKKCNTLSESDMGCHLIFGKLIFMVDIWHFIQTLHYFDEGLHGDEDVLSETIV